MSTNVPNKFINRPNKIVLHHSSASLSKSMDQTKAINDYHKFLWNDKSNLGMYGGYHLTIDGYGKITRYRNDDEIGLHCIGANSDSIGVCLQCDGNIEMPTKGQIASLIDILREYNLPVFFHREIQLNRTCPGALITREWFENIKNVKIKYTPRQLELQKRVEQISLLNKLLEQLKSLLKKYV